MSSDHTHITKYSPICLRYFLNFLSTFSSSHGLKCMKTLLIQLWKARLSDNSLSTLNSKYLIARQQFLLSCIVHKLKKKRNAPLQSQCMICTSQ